MGLGIRVIPGLLIRAVAVLLTFGVAAFLYAVRRTLARGKSHGEIEALRGVILADMLTSLGATYIKFGQILSTRPDLLGPGYIDALAKLQDQVPPGRYEEVERVLRSELSPDEFESFASLDREPLAAASVAQVHRGVLVSGEEVAVKVQRPNASSQIRKDLVLMKWAASMLDRFPSLNMLSLPGAVERFGEAMQAQLDFTQEARNNRRFAELFGDTEEIAVPALFSDLSTQRVLTMELIHGVRASEPERVGGDRKKLARIGFDAILRMVFRDGFVHADLHPGNLLLTEETRIVMIDLGLVAEIPDEMKMPWLKTFVALSQADAVAAAKLFYEYAPTVKTLDYAAYEAEVKDHFKIFAGKKLGEVEASEILGGMMNILRRHRVQIDPVFTVVNIAMLVAEGLGKQLDPDLDILSLAGPYVLQATSVAPKGRPPRRQCPTAAVAA